MIVGLEPRFLVLHALRLKGRAATAALATATGLPTSDTEAVLADLAEDGLVEGRPGPERPDQSGGAGPERPDQSGDTGAWTLTSEGRQAHARARDSAGSGDSAVLERIDQAYRRFLALNQPFKQLCTDWQLRDGDASTLNDHTDLAYDRSVIDRLSRLHADAREVADDLARASPRFRPYRERLESAHDRLLAGDFSAFTTPLTDSYHDVWMELHEDLLLTLGLARHEGVT